MTHATKNDRKHGTHTYVDADAAAIDWTELATNTVYRFMREHRLGETLGEFIERTHAPYPC